MATTRPFKDIERIRATSELSSLSRKKLLAAISASAAPESVKNDMRDFLCRQGSLTERQLDSLEHWSYCPEDCEADGFNDDFWSWP